MCIRDSPFYGPAGGVYIPRFQNLDSRTHPKFRRGFGVQGAIGRGNLSSDQPAIYGLMGFGETLPYFENCLTIDRRRKDAWGIPAVHIRCRLAENERELIVEQTRSIREMVEACGYKVTFSGSALGLDNPNEVFPDAGWLSRTMFKANFKKSMAVGAAIHECGGARMGADRCV